MSVRYTCRACTQALGNERRLFTLKPNVRRVSSNRSFVPQKSKIQSLSAENYTTTSHVTAANIPRARSYATEPSQHRATSSPATTIPKEIHLHKELDREQANIAAYHEKVAAQEAALASGQRVGIVDSEGETHVLAEIPEDVRTYTWRTPEWSWGVLERLVQDCEQAKVTFEFEDYVDERDGKTRRRIKRDKDGLHVGHGSGWWFEEIGLPQTFNTSALVSFLHMWILKVRIRQLPKKMSEHWSELLTNHFFWEAEKRMDLIHKMDGQDRKKNLEAFSQIWRGTILAYDEGLIKGDAVLATAIWRQLFDGQDSADPVKIALVTAYVRREVARLGWIDDETLAKGYVGFGEPVSEKEALVTHLSDKALASEASDTTST